MQSSALCMASQDRSVVSQRNAKKTQRHSYPPLQGFPSRASLCFCRTLMRLTEGVSWLWLLLCLCVYLLGMFDAPHGAVVAACMPAAVSINVKALREREPEHDSLKRYTEVAVMLTGCEHANYTVGMHRRHCPAPSAAGAFSLAQAHGSVARIQIALRKYLRGVCVCLRLGGWFVCVCVSLSVCVSVGV